MQVGVFTVMLPDLTPEQAVEELRDAGYDGVEWRVRDTAAELRDQPPSFWGNNQCTFPLSADQGRRAGELAASAGLAIPGLGTYTPVNDLAAVEEGMRFAQAAGAPQLRVSLNSLEGTYRERFDTAKQALTKIEEMARRYGLKAMVETHQDTITPSASLAHRLVSDCDPEVIGVLYDPGNMVKEGFEDYRIGLELLGPYLAHVHLKNAAWSPSPDGGPHQSSWAPLEDGVVDFQAVFDALAGVGYDGWLVFEDFSQKRPTRETLAHDLAFIQQFLSPTAERGTGATG